MANETKTPAAEANKPDPLKLITDALIAAGYAVNISTSAGVHDTVYHISVKK